MPDLCSDRNPANRGMACSLPPGHASPHAMGDGGTWPLAEQPLTTERAQTEPGSRSTCLNCSEPIIYDARDGWIHPDLVGIGVLGGDGVACDINPVAEPGDVVLPPAKGKPWCLCTPGVGPHDEGCPAVVAPPASEGGA